MPVEIGGSKPRSIDFTFHGKALFIKRLPLRVGLQMQRVSDGDFIPADVVAEIISSCVVYEDGSNVWSAEEVLDFDATSMMELFSEVSGLSVEEAEKN